MAMDRPEVVAGTGSVVVPGRGLQTHPCLPADRDAMQPRLQPPPKGESQKGLSLWPGTVDRRVPMRGPFFLLPTSRYSRVHVLSKVGPGARPSCRPARHNVLFAAHTGGLAGRHLHLFFPSAFLAQLQRRPQFDCDSEQAEALAAIAEPDWLPGVVDYLAHGFHAHSRCSLATPCPRRSCFISILAALCLSHLCCQLCISQQGCVHSDHY